MPRALAPALLLWLLAGHAAAEVRLQARGAHLDLTATAAPLTDVLDRLARQVGMKVQYDGPAPRQLVTLTLRDRTPSEAVLAVLEGLGVNFALVWDPSGAQLQTLVIAGWAGTATAAAAPRRPPAEPRVIRRPFGAAEPVGRRRRARLRAGAGGAGRRGRRLPETGRARGRSPGRRSERAGAAAVRRSPSSRVIAPAQQFPVSPVHAAAADAPDLPSPRRRR